MPLNEVRRLRLQSQILRHTALFYQKFPPTESAKNALATTAENTTNPFELLPGEDISRKVGNYVTFTRCELSADGSRAKLYVSIWGDTAEKRRVMRNIRRQAPQLRASIARNIRMRQVPQLVFLPDLSFDRASRIERLIDAEKERGSP
ncbi:MAG: 30S ribosome-binding factor RbfA [Turneriella sp.]|nr:30S ribosome-binding factor RbfA [Leptospiraceae bacterium]MCX7632188.1 30S ribosome-binding factor RbfA [Turneriella sp.]